MSETIYCQTCFQQEAAREDGLCLDCGRWQDYWEGLSPKEREREYEMMAAYASESSDG